MQFDRTIKNSVVALTFMLLALASPLNANAGFYLGGQLPVNMVQGDFDNVHMPKVDTGAGLGLIAGYRFIPAFSLEINWSASSHESVGASISFGEFSLNGKLFINAPSKTEFFLIAGIGSFALGDNSLMFGGTGYNLGIGLEHYVAPKLTLGFAVIRKIITYDRILKSDPPVNLVGTLNGDTTSLRFDITHHF
jgi:hypothetical protein